MALKHPLSGMPIPLGVVPQLIYQQRQSAKAKKRANPTEAAMEGVPTGMAKGGKVTRGDGACMKGRTKGKMY